METGTHWEAQGQGLGVSFLSCFFPSQAAFGPAGEWQLEAPAGNSGLGLDGGLGTQDLVCKAPSLPLGSLGRLSGQS